MAGDPRGIALNRFRQHFKPERVALGLERFRNPEDQIGFARRLAQGLLVPGRGPFLASLHCDPGAAVTQALNPAAVETVVSAQLARIAAAAPASPPAATIAATVPAPAAATTTP